MRITKKFAGASCIGKQVYQASDDFDENEARVAHGELAKLENAFLARLEGRGGSRSRVSTSAAAAAAAAAVASSGGGMYGRDDYDYDNDDGGYGDEEQYDDELDGAAGGGRGIVWSTSGRRSGGRGAGLPAGAVRMGGGSSRGIGRRVLSEPNLMLHPNSNSPSGGSGGGGGSSRRPQFKRAHSAMDLEDLRAFHIPADESGDSAAAQLLVKFMSKMGAEPSLSRPASMVDLAAAVVSASSSSSSSAEAQQQQPQKRQLSGEGVGVNETKGGTGKGIEGRRSSSAGTADTEDSTRSHSSGLQSIPEGEGRYSRDGGDTNTNDGSPVGLMMDDSDDQDDPSAMAPAGGTVKFGVFGSGVGPPV